MDRPPAAGALALCRGRRPGPGSHSVRLASPEPLPGIDLLAQGAKRGGVARQLPKQVGQELRDDNRLSQSPVIPSAACRAGTQRLCRLQDRASGQRRPSAVQRPGRGSWYRPAPRTTHTCIRRCSREAYRRSSYRRRRRSLGAQSCGRGRRYPQRGRVASQRSFRHIRTPRPEPSRSGAGLRCAAAGRCRGWRLSR